MPSRAAIAIHRQLALGTFVKLARAAESVSQALAPGLAAAGLTESQFGVLEALLHLGPLHQCDLAERILKSSGNMTTVIGNLERRGLIRRQPAATDRRFREVRLTPAGERLVRKVFAGHAERLTGVMGTLTEAEQRTLGRLCRKLGLLARAGAR
jgi:MarR family transcriptional regulator, 2-MHQ and catechol-resistance regulon repressor